MKAVRLEGVGPGPDDLLARWFEPSYASLVKAMKARMSKWILYAKWRTRTLSGICILAIARKRAAPEYNRRTVGGETMDREGEPGEVAARTSNAQAVAMMRSGTVASCALPWRCWQAWRWHRVFTPRKVERASICWGRAVLWRASPRRQESSSKTIFMSDVSMLDAPWLNGMIWFSRAWAQHEQRSRLPG